MPSFQACAVDPATPCKSCSPLRLENSHGERGIIDADLGGNLIKQRVARSGEGRSGGYRMIVAYRMQERRFSFTALPRMTATALRNVAAEMLAYTDVTLERLKEAGELQEIEDGKGV